MPLSRRITRGLAGDVSGAYGRAEVRLLELMARHLSQGLDAPDWAEVKLAELQTFRRRVEQIATGVTADAMGLTAQAGRTAYLRGTAAGQGDLVRAGIGLEDPPRQAEYAVASLVKAQQGQLEDLQLGIVRQTSDAYRDAVARASAGTLTGAATRVQDAQRALDDLARRGVTGFTDTIGRQWGLESYVDMATRTTTMQAAVQGQMDRLEDGGISLFIVSNSSRECPTCRPWEGKILSRGPVDALQRNVLTGQVEQVPVDGTVSEATSAGLFHPNCTHNLSGYIHGATKVDTDTGNPEGFAEMARQRQLERKVREWKRREAAAITPDAKARARGKVRSWQDAIRDHTEATGLPRKRRRESFDVKPPKVDPHPAQGVSLGQRDAELLDTEMGDLMAAQDYGPRFEEVAAELDRRDAARKAWTMPTGPNARAEQALVDDVLSGTWSRDEASAGGYAKRTAKDRERELRDEYDTLVHSQWLRAEAECRGVLLSKEGRAHNLDPIHFFTRRYTSLRMASPELQEWFAQRGNERLSFPEFRSTVVDDKRARKARQRRRNRGFESEFG